MFEVHPELLNGFSQANQAVGEQPKARDFTPIMQRIAHKHVSLGIKAAEYTIVGRYLLGAV